MKKILAWIPLLSLTVAAAEPKTELKKPGEAASIERVEIQGEAKPGGSVVAVVRVKLEKKWHVQSNKPSEPNFIATVLALGPAPGVKSSTIKYPEGKSEKVPGLAKPLSVYDEDFQITVLLNLDAGARLPLTIPATLTYQACQGAQCYMPRKLKLDITVGGQAKTQ